MIIFAYYIKYQIEIKRVSWSTLALKIWHHFQFVSYLSALLLHQSYSHTFLEQIFMSYTPVNSSNSFQVICRNQSFFQWQCDSKKNEKSYLPVIKICPWNLYKYHVNKWNIKKNILKGPEHSMTNTFYDNISKHGKINLLYCDIL